MTHLWIQAKAKESFRQADIARKELRTAGQVKRYLSRMRQMFLERLGGLPGRGPLNGRVLASVKRETHRIEHVVFESYPGLLVSANLYLPKRMDGPAAGVVVAMGHENDGKAFPEYQKVCLDLVLNGFVVLGFDPIGQGERIQFPGKRRFKSRLVSCVNEHASLGWRSELLGISLGGMMLWDGIRAIDYLSSRPEVDANRIGMAGCSGGGTQTTFVSAVDRRLKAVVPNCFIANRRSLIRHESILFDPEQVQFGVIRDGLDHAELLGLMAPAAVLVQGGLRDLFFHPDATRWSVRTARRWYGMLGMPDRMALQHEDVGHGYARPFREATVRWFARWLRGQDVEFTEPKLKTESPRDLWCARSGNVLELGSRTVLEVLRERFGEMSRSRRKKDTSGKKSDTANILQKAIGLPGRGALRFDGKAKSCGKARSGGYEISRYLVRSEAGINIPTVVLQPQSACQCSGKAVIVVSEKGKRWEIENNRHIARWLERKDTVVLADLRGWGETRQTKKIWQTPTDYWCRQIGHEGFLEQWLLQLGDSLIACRARDLAAVLAFTSACLGVSNRHRYVFSRGIAAWSAAILGNFRPFGGLAVVDFLASYEQLLGCEVSKIPPNYVIHGLAERLDFPEVLAQLSPMPLWVSRPLAATGKKLTPPDYRSFIKPIKAAYASAAARANLREELSIF